MAIQTLIGKPSFGESFGTGISSGISKGLEALAKQKAESLKANSMRQFTQALYGQPAPQEGAMAPGAQVQPGQVAPQQGQPSVADLLGMPAGTPEQERMLLDYIGKQQLAQQKISASAEQKEKDRAQKEKLFYEGLSEKQQARIDQETLKVQEQIEKENRGVDQEILELNEFKQLTDEGQIGTPLSNALLKTGANLFFKSAGKDVPTDWVLPIGAQKQIKLSANFLKNAIQSIEGRKSQYLLQQLSKAYPNIWQAPEAQKYVADILLYENHMKKARERALYDITEEHGGVRPRNIRQLIKERIGQWEPEVSRRFLPQATSHQVGQQVDELPAPFLTQKNALYADGPYIYKNTGKKWVKYGKNPDYKG